MSGDGDGSFPPVTAVATAAAAAAAAGGRVGTAGRFPSGPTSFLSPWAAGAAGAAGVAGGPVNGASQQRVAYSPGLLAESGDGSSADAPMSADQHNLKSKKEKGKIVKSSKDWVHQFHAHLDGRLPIWCSEHSTLDVEFDHRLLTGDGLESTAGIKPFCRKLVAHSNCPAMSEDKILIDSLPERVRVNETILEGWMKDLKEGRAENFIVTVLSHFVKKEGGLMVPFMISLPVRSSRGNFAKGVHPEGKKPKPVFWFRGPSAVKEYESLLRSYYKVSTGCIDEERCKAELLSDTAARMDWFRWDDGGIAELLLRLARFGSEMPPEGDATPPRLAVFHMIATGDSVIPSLETAEDFGEFVQAKVDGVEVPSRLLPAGDVQMDGVAALNGESFTTERFRDFFRDGTMVDPLNFYHNRIVVLLHDLVKLKPHLPPLFPNDPTREALQKYKTQPESDVTDADFAWHLIKALHVLQTSIAEAAIIEKPLHSVFAILADSPADGIQHPHVPGRAAAAASVGSSLNIPPESLGVTTDRALFSGGGDGGQRGEKRRAGGSGGVSLLRSKRGPYKKDRKVKGESVLEIGHTREPGQVGRPRKVSRRVGGVSVRVHYGDKLAEIDSTYSSRMSDVLDKVSLLCGENNVLPARDATTLCVRKGTTAIVSRALENVGSLAICAFGQEHVDRLYVSGSAAVVELELISVEEYSARMQALRQS
uniref:Uncharacterized protein n=1 Tax=Chromera velia CCMP2878 TaxID=1169474 RepID=A0A0G4G8E4_9ALVE|eukprot:Cvel_4311.t1-p1 / transcript=Cvel_4311.t1 / gene=Cvel_4311 / organism=Chromera_velia_CCMP2878 / gene_product=hypothetical protein / transcript_product=hypothetical protein / location=Cvel_scaffold187:16861-20308(+) / protein_length=707 / sequence_SO=supercontig / SO=protein_coding / is_pseudo=false